MTRPDRGLKDMAKTTVDRGDRAELREVVRSRRLDSTFIGLTIIAPGNPVNASHQASEAERILKLLIDHAKRTLGGER